MKRLLHTLVICSLPWFANAQSNAFTQTDFDQLCESTNSGVAIIPQGDYQLTTPLVLNSCDVYAKNVTFNVAFATNSEHPAITISPTEGLPGPLRLVKPCRIKVDEECLYNTQLRTRGKIVLPKLVNASNVNSSVAVKMIDVAHYRIDISQITGFDTGIELIANDQVAYNDFFFEPLTTVANMKNNTNFVGTFNYKRIGEKAYYGWINQLNFHQGTFETISDDGAQLTFNNSIRRYANAYTWHNSNFKNGTIKLEGDNFVFNKTEFTDRVTLISNNYVCQNGVNCVDRDGQTKTHYISRDNLINMASNTIPKCQQEYSNASSVVSFTAPETCTSNKHVRVEKKTVEYIQENLAR